jgi:hypothetical protein
MLNSEFYRVVAGIGLAVMIFVVFSLLSRKAGLRAVEKWCDAKGFQILRARPRFFVRHWRSLWSRRFQFFHVVVRDKTGVEHRGWMRLESECTEPAVLDVIWDDQKP